MRLCALVAACLAALKAQFLPDLQAKTPEEFDAYIGVARAADAKSALTASRQFVKRFPDSAMRLRVFELEFEACRTLGDAGCAERAAKAGLEIAPAYIPLLTGAASVVANTSQDPKLLAAARARAEQALKLLAEAKAPRSVTPEQWLDAVSRLKAEALAASGVTLHKAGDSAGAVRQLEAAVAARASAENQFRLALLYREAGRAAEARRLLEAVMASGEPSLRSRAKQVYDASQ